MCAWGIDEIHGEWERKEERDGMRIGQKREKLILMLTAGKLENDWQQIPSPSTITGPLMPDYDVHHLDYESFHLALMIIVVHSESYFLINLDGR